MLGYLFYSTLCKHSLDLMKIMENQGLLPMFELKSVNTMDINEITRLGLNATPTILIINNDNGKQSKGIYESKDAFKWVDNVITNRRQNMIQFAEQRRRLIEIDETRKRMEDGLSENCQMERQGISDVYAFCKEDNDMYQPKAFVPALEMGNDAYRVMTIPQGRHVEKLSEIDQKMLIKDLESKRKIQDTDMKSNMEKEQISKVIHKDNIYF